MKLQSASPGAPANAASECTPHLSKSQLSGKLPGTSETAEVRTLPKPSRVFIDKLALTIDLSGACRSSEFASKLMKLKQDGVALQTRGLRSYSKNYLLAAASSLGPAVLVSVGPRNPGHRAIRLEWNPANADEWVLHQSFAHVFRSDDRLVDHATVTRIDIAVDINGVSIEDLAVTAAKYTRTKAFFNKGLG